MRVILLTEEWVCDRPAELERHFDETLDEGAVRIAVDLSQVPTLSDTSLGIFVKAMKRAREEGGDVRLFAASSENVKFIALLGLDVVFPLYLTERDAVASFDA